MRRIPARSALAAEAVVMVTRLQDRFVEGLERLSVRLGSPERFEAKGWLRANGRHGGGVRYATGDGPMIGRGSVNVSQVHYDDAPDRRLGSATAISTIIHPRHPRAPSVHIHLSWTEQKTGDGYWRMMADLNPAIENRTATRRFLGALHEAAPAQFDAAIAQGGRYFFIPALGRHRGVAHFYLEHYHGGDFTTDLALARAVGEGAIDTYLAIVEAALAGPPPPSEAERAAQLAYHTLYLFQVLTLDRGTTTGLLVHDQNDLGILGSLPARVDRRRLESWLARLAPPQDGLLRALIDGLPHDAGAIDDVVKGRLAGVVRDHYRAHPEAIAMQASGDTIPPTVQNHR